MKQKSNPTQEPILLVIGDLDAEHQEFKLVATFEGIAEAEQILDRSLIINIRPKDIASPTIQLVRALFYGETREHHPDLTMQTIREIVTRENFGEIAGKVLAAWARSMTTAKKAAADPPAPPS